MTLSERSPSLCPGDLVLLSRAHSCTQRAELVIDRRVVPAVFVGVSDFRGFSTRVAWLTFLCELGLVQTTHYWVEEDVSSGSRLRKIRLLMHREVALSVHRTVITRTLSSLVVRTLSVLH